MTEMNSTKMEKIDKRMILTISSNFSAAQKREKMAFIPLNSIKVTSSFKFELKFSQKILFGLLTMKETSFQFQVQAKQRFLKLYPENYISQQEKIAVSFNLNQNENEAEKVRLEDIPDGLYIEQENNFLPPPEYRFILHF